jgi:hypothetical protein
MSQNELRVLRRRIDDAYGRLARRRARRSGLGSPAMLGKVVDGGNMPHGVPGVFRLKPQRVSFLEREGAPVSFHDLAGQPVTTVLRNKAPAAGNMLPSRLIGGRWVSEFGVAKEAPCCQCVPKVLVLDSDMTVNDASKEGIFTTSFTTQVSWPITLTYGPAPIRTAAIWGQTILLGADGGEAIGFFSYVQLPAQGWFSGPVDDGLGNTVIYWLWVSSCALYVMPLGPGTITMTLNDGSTASYDGMAFPQAVTWAALGKKNCDNLDVGIWALNGRQRIENAVFEVEVFTDMITLTGQDLYYYPGCVPLDENNSAGVGQTKIIPGGGSGIVVGGAGWLGSGEDGGGDINAGP